MKLNQLMLYVSALALVTVAFAPGAAAHWGDGANAGGPGPAGGATGDVPHHVYVSPGAVDMYGLQERLCTPAGPLLSTHLGFNQANREWHTVSDNDPSGGAGPVPGSHTPNAEAGGPGGETVVPDTTPNHAHHPSDPSPGSNVVHNQILAGDFFPLSGILAAPQVTTPDYLATGDVSTPSLPPCGGAGAENPLPQNPTGAGLTFGMDFSTYVWLDDRCIDHGDGDAEYAFGGGFLSYSVKPGDSSAPALTGCALPSQETNGGWGDAVDGPNCPAPCTNSLLSPGAVVELGREHSGTGADNAEGTYTGGTTGVQMSDLAFSTPNGFTYTVCFDESNNGVCTTNLVASNDAFDECLYNSGPLDSTGVPAAVGAGADVDLFFGFVDGVASVGAGYVGVFDDLTFYGNSTAGSAVKCWPKKAAGAGVGDLSAAGPGEANRGLPGVSANQNDNLVVFTSMCVADPGVDAPPPPNKCPSGASNPSGPSTGFIGVNAQTNSAGFDLTVAGTAAVSLDWTTEPTLSGPAVVRAVGPGATAGATCTATATGAALGPAGAANTWAVVATSPPPVPTVTVDVTCTGSSLHSGGTVSTDFRLFN